MQIKGKLQLIRTEEETDLEPERLKIVTEYPGIPQCIENTWPLRIAGWFEALGAQDGDLIRSIEDDWPDRENFLALCVDVGKGNTARRGIIRFESILRRRKWAASYEIVPHTPAVEMPVEAAAHSLDQAK